MAYKVVIKESAEKDLRGIDKTQGRRILAAIERKLSEAPRKFGESLKGKYKGFWKMYVVPYRVIYFIDDREETVFIVKLGHRKDVYR